MAPTDDKELARIHLSDSTSGATVTQTESTGSVSLTPPDSIVVQYSPDEIVQLVVMEDTLLLKLQTLHDRGTDLTWATTALGVGITLGVTVLTSVFHPIHHLSGHTVQGFLAAIAVVSLSVAGWKFSRFVTHRVTPEAIVKDIKQTSVRRPSTPSPQRPGPPSIGA